MLAILLASIGSVSAATGFMLIGISKSEHDENILMTNISLGLMIGGLIMRRARRILVPRNEARLAEERSRSEAPRVGTGILRMAGVSSPAIVFSAQRSPAGVPALPDRATEIKRTGHDHGAGLTRDPLSQPYRFYRLSAEPRPVLSRWLAPIGGVGNSRPGFPRTSGRATTTDRAPGRAGRSSRRSAWRRGNRSRRPAGGATVRSGIMAPPSAGCGRRRG